MYHKHPTNQPIRSSINILFPPPLATRLFMIMSTVGKFITARAQPRLVLIQPEITGTTLTLRAPGMLDFHLDIAQLNANATLDTVIWGVPLSGAIDCGEEIARWLSRFIHSEDTGLRLIHYPHAAPTRAVRDADRRRWRAFQPRDTGAMHDTTSYMLMAEASLAELNGRLAALEEPQPPVPVLQFRPNLVVKGTRVAFEEDAYRWVRIGDAVVMRNVRPCTRCIFTNIDPETGRRNAAGQPLALLKSYRRVVPDDGPVLGIHLGMRAGYGGSVSVGDAVYVEDE